MDLICFFYNELNAFQYDFISVLVVFKKDDFDFTNNSSRIICRNTA